MVSCRTIDFISFLEGEDPKGEMKRHIDGCAKCRLEAAKYQRLIDGLAKSCSTLTTSCHRRDQAADWALKEGEPDLEHLTSCPDCREVYELVDTALRNLQGLRVPPLEQLPEAVKEKVERRRERYMRRRINRVFDFLDIKDRKQQGRLIKGLLDETEVLPLAAFPDDLAESDKKKRKGGRNKDKRPKAPK